ncbi:uncharacterized protein LOC128246288 [Mya arenaria]|uniref:uncharacterized protein LOC128246288 n=1 Tax=Mya arenaria TaxID=6604 RepID=UPI0022E386DC|nr:uncharacterized protein LOC128246288 [Mya arenaria]
MYWHHGGGQVVFAIHVRLYGVTTDRIDRAMPLPPEVTLHMPLSLLKVVSLPVPVNSTTDHATKLLHFPQLFAITSNTQLHLVNLALLQHFFNDSELHNINSNSLKIHCLWMCLCS